jgi:hypothetical protein
VRTRAYRRFLVLRRTASAGRTSRSRCSRTTLTSSG